MKKFYSLLADNIGLVAIVLIVCALVVGIMEPKKPFCKVCHCQRSQCTKECGEDRMCAGLCEKECKR